MSIVTNDLERGFEIHWYQIESVLGRGGFGITYLAWDRNLDKNVAIKEYLPHDFAKRDEDSTVQPFSREYKSDYSYGLDRFMKEAKILAKFKHPNISHVSSYFELNNTGYMVMDYEHGKPLNEVYETQGKLTQQELEDIYLPVMDGLSLVHEAGFIHRDIKPPNIYIRHDNSPVLIDFGAARQTMRPGNMTLTAMLTEGYAPSEQYNQNSDEQGPWTDIYALGACLYQGITGEKPVSSIERTHCIYNKNIDPLQPLSRIDIDGYSRAFLRAIDEALMVRFGDRPTTLEAFVDMLKGEISLPDLPAPGPTESHTSNDGLTVVRPVSAKASGSSKSGGPEGSTKTRKRADVASAGATAEVDIPTGPDSTTADSTTAAYALAESTARKRGFLPLGAGIMALLIGSVVAWLFLGQSQISEPSVEEAAKDEQQQLQKLQAELELKEALLAQAEAEREAEDERFKREQAERELLAAKMAQKAREGEEAVRQIEQQKQSELAKQRAEKKKQAELAKQQAEKKKQAELAKQQADIKKQAELAKQQAELERQAELAQKQAERERTARVQAHLKRADGYFTKGQFELAMQHYEKVLDLNPNSEELGLVTQGVLKSRSALEKEVQKKIQPSEFRYVSLTGKHKGQLLYDVNKRATFDLEIAEQGNQIFAILTFNQKVPGVAKDTMLTIKGVIENDTIAYAYSSVAGDDGKGVWKIKVFEDLVEGTLETFSGKRYRYNFRKRSSIDKNRIESIAALELTGRNASTFLQSVTREGVSKYLFDKISGKYRGELNFGNNDRTRIEVVLAESNHEISGKLILATSGQSVIRDSELSIKGVMENGMVAYAYSSAAGDSGTGFMKFDVFDKPVAVTLETFNRKKFRFKLKRDSNISADNRQQLASIRLTDRMAETYYQSLVTDGGSSALYLNFSGIYSGQSFDKRKTRARRYTEIEISVTGSHVSAILNIDYSGHSLEKNSEYYIKGIVQNDYVIYAYNANGGDSGKGVWKLDKMQDSIIGTMESFSGKKIAYTVKKRSELKASSIKNISELKLDNSDAIRFYQSLVDKSGN